MSAKHPNETSPAIDVTWYDERGLHKPGDRYDVGARPGNWRGPWPELVVPMVLASDYEALAGRLTEAKRLLLDSGPSSRLTMENNWAWWYEACEKWLSEAP